MSHTMVNENCGMKPADFVHNDVSHWVGANWAGKWRSRAAVGARALGNGAFQKEWLCNFWIRLPPPPPTTPVSHWWEQKNGGGIVTCGSSLMCTAVSSFPNIGNLWPMNVSNRIEELHPSPLNTNGTNILRVSSQLQYRGLGIYDVKGLVHVFFGKLHNRGERGKKQGSAKFQNKAHRTFDIINT